MPAGTMQGVLRFLIQAFEDLGTSIPNDRLEKMAVMVYSAMSNPARHYHNLDHVFNFSNPADPIQYLAAVFHDIVYFQVDSGIPRELENIILPFLHQEGDNFYLTSSISTSDTRTRWLSDIFDFRAGQSITYTQGLNEFLSALVMVNQLGGLIDEHDLFQIAVCIEATIPFRGLNEEGSSNIDLLAKRLYDLRERYPFFGTPEQIDSALKRAVVFSNQDVETFRTKDPAQFLVITYKLLPESNAALRNHGVFTIRDYRIGLQNTEKFLRGLNPDNVFNNYKGVPSVEEYSTMLQQAKNNLKTTRRYLVVKLLVMGILEGLAEVTGGDVPLSLFMGDKPRPGINVKRIEDYIPEIPLPDFVDPNSDLLRLFNAGQAEFGYDLPNSPISLFVYKSLRIEEQDQLFELTKTVFNGELSADEYLKKVPSQLLSTIARASAELVITRREKLLAYT